jgi:hypothetical protein
VTMHAPLPDVEALLLAPLRPLRIGSAETAAEVGAACAGPSGGAAPLDRMRHAGYGRETIRDPIALNSRTRRVRLAWGKLP